MTDVVVVDESPSTIVNVTLDSPVDVIEVEVPGPPGPPGEDGSDGDSGPRRIAPAGYWLPVWPFGSYTTITHPLQEIRSTPTHWDAPVDAIAVEVTVLQVGPTVQAGVYATNPDGSGGALLATSQAEGTDTIGGKTLVLDTTIPAGDYWVAIHVAGTGTAPTLRSGSNNTPDRLYSNQANPTSAGAYNCRYQTAVPALPATLPTGGARLGMPICWIRIAPTKD